ncbi:MAG: hypothetical protein B7Z55_02100 [Planctomycetales bacterium 12-60-4]|nr:MAG: hypothetical protein B7Z55_02100 [Planctomycetales bacterium 12-60-4]
MLTAALSKLSPADRLIAEQQRFCPVLDGSRLGSMGIPVKLTIDGQTVFVCCPGCQRAALEDSDATLKKVATAKASRSAPAQPPPRGSGESGDNPKIRAALAGLSDTDRTLAEQQRFCAVLTSNRLGTMGPPVKVLLGTTPVFVCCAECLEKALAEPDPIHRQAEELRRKWGTGSRLRMPGFVRNC